MKKYHKPLIIADPTFDNYQSARNDGDLEDGVVASFDASGNLKKKIINPLQKEITVDYTLLPTDKGILLFNSATPITITIDNTLPDKHELQFYNRGAGLVTFLAGTGVIISVDGLTLETGKVATIFKYLDTNEYILKGELA